MCTAWGYPGCHSGLIYDLISILFRLPLSSRFFLPSFDSPGLFTKHAFCCLLTKPATLSPVSLTAASQLTAPRTKVQTLASVQSSMPTFAKPRLSLPCLILLISEWEALLSWLMHKSSVGITFMCEVHAIFGLDYNCVSQSGLHLDTQTATEDLQLDFPVK